MQNFINSLKNNFLFQASLGSKELFHSNMLAWMLEQKNDKEEFEVLSYFIKTVAKVDVEIITKENTHKIAREENKIDLTIKWKSGNDWNLIFIENKMKSIPTKKQLEEYDGKIDNLVPSKTRIGLDRKVLGKLLLTPFESKVKSEKTKIPWTNITYSEEIIRFLKEIMGFEFANAKETNIKMVIEKYISFLEDQNEIIRSLNLDSLENFKNRHYDFYSKETVNNDDDNEEPSRDNEEVEKHYMTEVRSLRLHDLVLKLTHSMISDLIRQKLEKSFKGKLKSSVAELKKSPGNILIASGFTRSTGITDVNIYIDKGISLVLQLQGNTLKYAVQVHGKAANMLQQNLEFAKALEKDKKQIWFHDMHSVDKVLLSGKGKKNKEQLRINDKTVFNSYGLNFIYLNKDIKEYQHKPISDLVDFICSEVTRVQDNLFKFQNILNK